MLTPVTSQSSLRLSDDEARLAPHLASRLLGNERLKERFERALERLGELQELLYADRRYALLVILQGRDASGKDGTIKHVFDACDPIGCTVTSFKAPTELELSHDFLWRVHAAVPPLGMIGIFNRSHYEDVLVVRVKKLAPRSVWSKRYDQINAFERLLAENHVVILKFLLHVSKQEQRERLIARLDDPTKNWKFRAGDLGDRALWDDYTRAYRDALRKCSTPYAPWYVVPADHKPTRNLLITEQIVATLERLRLRYPRAEPDVLKLRKQIR